MHQSGNTHNQRSPNKRILFDFNWYLPRRLKNFYFLNWSLSVFVQVNLCQKLFFLHQTNPKYEDKLFIEWRPGIALGVTQKQPAVKLITWHAKSRTTKSIPGLYYKFNTWKFQAQTWGEHVVFVYRNCVWHSEQFLFTTCSPHVLQKEKLLIKIYL